MKELKKNYMSVIEYLKYLNKKGKKKELGK